MQPGERVQVPGGFLAASERLSGDVFVLTEEWQDRFTEIFERPGVVGLRLSRGVGWRGEDIGFVADLPPLRAVELIGWGPSIDASPLYAHKELEHLALERDYRKCDFSRLPGLQICELRWRRGSETILECEQLRFLWCMGFPWTDLSRLATLGELEELRVESRKLQSAQGIGALEQLRHVSFIYCTVLEDISECARSSNLETALFHACKRVNEIDVLAGLPRLRKLVMENCGEVRSVAAFEAARSLEELLLMGVRVQDGNLEPLKRAPKLQRFKVAKSRNHSHTCEEIEQALQAGG